MICRENIVNQRLRWIADHEYTRFIGLGALAGLILLTVALVWRGARNETIVLQVQSADDSSVLQVYVGGEVRSPGLYTLERGSRVADAIEAAGGITAVGDTSNLGMAAPLRDADQIIVGRILPSADAGETPRTSTQAGSGTIDSAAININTASVEELESLPGIGPAIAGRIIDYRQRHGFFRSVDELEHVQGISHRMVEELRPLLTTGP